MLDELAQQHATLAISAAASRQWPEAVKQAERCRDVSPAGTLWHVWALHMLACTYADMGKPGLTKRFAQSFLRQVHQIPKLARFTPFVLRALHQVAYQERRFDLAAHYAQRALVLFAAAGDSDQATRTALNVVWSHARAGRPDAARRALPNAAPDSMIHLVQGAKAAIFAAENRWGEALEAGYAAIKGARLAHDNADAAEVLLIMVEAGRKSGASVENLAFLHNAAKFAARQARSLYSLQVLSQRAGGGELLHVRAATARGSADLHDLGCFTTGVA